MTSDSNHKDPIMYHTQEMYYNAANGQADSVTIRPATEEDAEALMRLAQRDSSPLPSGETLVALEGDEVRAAVAVETNESIADPFHHTAAMVRMLQLHARQIRMAVPRPPHRSGLGLRFRSA